MRFYLTVAAIAAIAAPVLAYPLVVESIDGPQDPLFVDGPVHELGCDYVFPPDEAIRCVSFTVTNETACFDGSDDQIMPNYIIEIINLTSVAWDEVYYVADPETGISNFDGWIGNSGLADHEEAFRIDSVGINRPLVFESMITDDIFQPGELWWFIIQDYTSPVGPPLALDSLGIASASPGAPPSTGSIIIPEPASLSLLAIGGLALLRRRRKA